MSDLFEQNPNVVPVVRVKDGGVFANSRDVAAFFGKQHKDVLRRYDRLECSSEFNERNFAPVDYLDEKGEARRSVDMTRDGFMFVVMGFTGKRAAAATMREKKAPAPKSEGRARRRCHGRDFRSGHHPSAARRRRLRRRIWCGPRPATNENRFTRQPKANQQAIPSAYWPAFL